MNTRPFVVPFSMVACVWFLSTNTFVHADNIFVGFSTTNIIKEYDSGGNGSTYATLANFPGAVAHDQPNSLVFDSSGNLYAAMANANEIVKIDPSRRVSVFASNSPSSFLLSRPLSMAFDSAGNLYVANYDTSYPFNPFITKFDPSGKGSIFYIWQSEYQWSAGIAFDRSGNLYASAFYTEDIQVIDPSNPNAGPNYFATSGLLNDPYGLAFDHSGNLFVANSYGRDIVKYATNGTSTVFATTGNSEANDIAFDSSGNLYAAYWNTNTIERFDTNGVGSVFVTSGSNAPLSIAIEVLPLFQITSIAPTNTADLLISWNTFGTSNIVQVGSGSHIDGSFSTSYFSDLTNIVVTTTTTNFWDVGAATNAPARYYRIRSPP